MHLHALQQAHHSAAQRRYAPAPQQDALGSLCLVQRFPKAQNFGTLAHFLGFTLRSSP